MSTDAGEGLVASSRAFDEDELEGARVYAEALLNATEKEGLTEEAIAEIAEIREDILDRFPAFAEMLTSNSLSVERRDSILADALGGRALPVVENFLRVLNRHGRLGLVGPIIDQAHLLLNRRQNRRPVRVATAVPLDGAEVEALKARLILLLGGATPVLKFEVDPSLLGGLVVQAGDDLYDLSVRSRLAQLRKQLVETKAREIRSQSATFVSA